MSSNKKGTSAKSTRSAKSNKVYRSPPTPTPGQLSVREKSFVLDCEAVSNISSDYSRANPKLGPVIPPYNSQKDKYVSNYFKFVSVNKTLKKNDQHFKGGDSIEGPVLDKFHRKGSGYQYLRLRNENGAGHGPGQTDGHAQFMSGIKPIDGFNGRYGFRRNTPWLRYTPSPFGVAPLSATQ